MPELRWILLVLGALLVAGLWWWELKRSRAKSAPPPVEQEPPRSPERHEPKFGEYDADDAEGVDLPSIRAEERPVPRGDPPVLTIDDLPEDVDQVVLAPDAPEPRRLEPMSARRDAPGAVVPEAITIGSTESSPSATTETPPMHATRAEPPAPPARPVAPRRDALPSAEAAVAPRSPAPTTPSAPAPASRPTGAGDRPAGTAASAPAVAPAGASPPARPVEPGGVESRRPAARPGRTASPAERLDEPRAAPSEPPSPLQKIVALRLVSATGDRIHGGQLRAALEAEGMRFGKYSIFHRQRADGKAIYSAASLLEPGSFDLDRMDAEQYPGISMFAVYPGPIDAPEAFDELLATARRLSDRLDVVPQDERGAPLGAQRALAIREELVHFQGLVNKTRSRTGG
jgi:cell division protein ZipA